MKIRKYLNLGLHWLFVVIFFASAVGKLLDNRGFATVISTYDMSLPEWLLLPLALGVSLFEGLVFVFLICKKNLYRVGIILILIHLSYSILALITNLRGLALTNCGCFGVFWGRSMTWNTVIEDLILTFLSFVYWQTLPALENKK